MGLFSKKSEEQIKAEKKIDEICGGFLGNDIFRSMLEKNNLDKTNSNVNYKSVLKTEIKNKTLNYEDIETRLNELMKLDVDTLANKIRVRDKQDTSLFKTQQDINDYLGAEYIEKYNKAMEKEEGKRAKKLEKKEVKIKKLEDKFGIDLTGKKWFKCGIEEEKYSTFSNQKRRNVDDAYVIINEDNFEIIKESVFLKSKMGNRKLYFYNITSIDYDARGRLHASSSVIINTKSAEHIQLKFVNKMNFDLMNDAFESYLEKTHKPQPAPIQQNISTMSPADELLKYAELYEKGLLTKEEFDLKKSELLFDKPSVEEQSYSIDENNQMEDSKSKFCKNCGSEVDSDSIFCTNCGSKL